MTHHFYFQFPRLTIDALNGYLAPFSTSIQDKIKSLYAEKFLTTSEGDKFFVSKKVCYT